MKKRLKLLLKMSDAKQAKQYLLINIIECTYKYKMKSDVNLLKNIKSDCRCLEQLQNKISTDKLIYNVEQPRFLSSKEEEYLALSCRLIGMYLNKLNGEKSNQKIIQCIKCLGRYLNIHKRAICILIPGIWAQIFKLFHGTEKKVYNNQQRKSLYNKMKAEYNQLERMIINNQYILEGNKTDVEIDYEFPDKANQKLNHILCQYITAPAEEKKYYAKRAKNFDHYTIYGDNGEIDCVYDEITKHIQNVKHFKNNRIFKSLLNYIHNKIYQEQKAYLRQFSIFNGLF